MPDLPPRIGRVFIAARVSPIARRHRGDAAVAVGLCAVLTVVDWLVFGLSPREIAVACVCAGALTVRRTAPGAALAAVTVALAWPAVQLQAPSAIDAAGLVALYSSWRWGGTAVRLAAALVGLFGSAVGGALPTRLPADTAAQAAAVTALFYLVLAVTACGAGQLARTRDELAEQSRLRAQQAEAEQRQRLELVATRERARVARDVHDVVAHSLTVIAVQAQAGRYAADADPAAAAEALDAIATTAKESLGEVREVLHLLRSPAADDRMTVADLQRRANSVGLRATVTEAGTSRAVRPDITDTAYRVVQEALTNTLRYAGASARATVRLTWLDDHLALDVSNRGGHAPAPVTEGSGMGLLGMRERLTELGGTFHAGPTDGGFAVQATIPYERPVR